MTAVRLLSAAAQIAGGRRALAARLKVGEAVLTAFMAGERTLPDSLLLGVVDIILEERDAQAGGRLS